MQALFAKTRQKSAENVHFRVVDLFSAHANKVRRDLRQVPRDRRADQRGVEARVLRGDDRIAPDALVERAEHYRPQLEAYSLALAQVIGKPVKEKILYFLRRSEQITL